MNVATKVIAAQIMKDDYGWPMAGQQAQVAFMYDDIEIEVPGKTISLSKEFADNQSHCVISEKVEGDSEVDLPEVIEYQPYFWLNQAIRNQGLPAKPLEAVSFEPSDQDERVWTATSGTYVDKVEAVINAHFNQFEAPKYK